MKNVFRTRSETANRVYRNFRTGPDKFPILFGFDVSKGISCSKSSVARNFEQNFHFRNFRIFQRWTIGGPPVGKPPRNLIFPHHSLYTVPVRFSVCFYFFRKRQKRQVSEKAILANRAISHAHQSHQK